MPSDRSRREIAHLFRRAGFGATRADLTKWVPLGREAAVDFLLNYEDVDNSAADAETAARDLWDDPYAMTLAWLLRMVHSARPLQERMAFFWQSLFSNQLVKVDNPILIWQQNELFRKNALPNWGGLLYAVAKDPAMLVYLDNHSSRKEHPNENYARELLELHTFGQGVGYTEVDIREAARAFTGWSVDYRTDERKALTDELNARLAEPGISDADRSRLRTDYRFRAFQLPYTYLYRANYHDDKSKTFLGKTGNFDGSAIIDIVVGRREAAQYICTRLYKWFVAPSDPPAATLSGLVDTYFSSGYELKPVVRQILLSEDFWSDAAYRSKVKSPVEFAVGMARQLEAFTTGTSLVDIARGLGQAIFDPPNPAGWTGQKAWINGNTLIGRTNNATRISTGRAPALPADLAKATDYWDPAPFIREAGVSEAGTIVDLFLSILIDGEATTAARNVLTEYMHTDDTGNYKLFTLNDANVDKKVRGLVFLILSSPAYNLA